MGFGEELAGLNPEAATKLFDQALAWLGEFEPNVRSFDGVVNDALQNYPALRAIAERSRDYGPGLTAQQLEVHNARRYSTGALLVTLVQLVDKP